MAVSEARLPTVPTKPMTKGSSLGGTLRSLSFSRATIRPDSSHIPMARVMVSTRPRGAKPVKLVTMLFRNHRRPASEMGFCTATTSLVAGFTTETPIRPKMQLMMATMKNR